MIVADSLLENSEAFIFALSTSDPAALMSQVLAPVEILDNNSELVYKTHILEMMLLIVSSRECKSCSSCLYY